MRALSTERGMIFFIFPGLLRPTKSKEVGSRTGVLHIRARRPLTSPHRAHTHPLPCYNPHRPSRCVVAKRLRQDQTGGPQGDILDDLKSWRDQLVKDKDSLESLGQAPGVEIGLLNRAIEEIENLRSAHK
jgi:hypothetical protein